MSDKIDFPIILEGTLCSLQTWNVQFGEQVTPHANNYNVWKNLRDEFPHPYTIELGRSWGRMNETK
jgi:hypothetical protein